MQGLPNYIFFSSSNFFKVIVKCRVFPNISRPTIASWAPQTMTSEGIFFLGHRKACPPRKNFFLGTSNHVPLGDFWLGHHKACPPRGFLAWAPQGMSPKGIFLLGHLKSCPPRGFLARAPQVMSPKGIFGLGTKNYVPQEDVWLGFLAWGPPPQIMSHNGIFRLGHHHHACP